MNTTLTRRHWTTVAACTLAGLVVGLLTTLGAATTYESATTLYIDAPHAVGVSEELKGVQLSGQLRESFAAIATAPSSLDEIIDRLDLTTTPDALAGRISTETNNTTLLIEIRATGSDPTETQQIAAASAEVLIDRVTGLSAGGGSVTATIVDASRPGDPVPPSRVIPMGIGGLLGMLIGLGIASVTEQFDDRVRSIDDTAARMGAVPIAAIPRAAGLDGVQIDGKDVGTESFRVLASAVAARAVADGEQVRSIAVTSASAGDGKTTVALNLALGLSLSGRRVVLVDADLRRSTLTERCGFDASLGLSDVFLGRCELDEALIDCNPTLRFLPAGPTPPNPSSVAESSRVAEMLDLLAAEADFVVIDTPPTVAVSEGGVLASHADATLVVVREGRTSMASLGALIHRIDTLGGRVFASVQNASRNAQMPKEYRRSGYQARQRVSK